MLTKHRDRKLYLLRLSKLPVLICVVSFARSVVYRLTYKPPECSSFGWFSSSSGEFNCDHKPLDFHATLALLWLATFSIQVLLLDFGYNKMHRLFGKIGFVIAILNAGGMFWLAIHDTYHPMEKTDRPADFTPFMFLVAVKLTACLVLAMKAIADTDYEAHMLWIFRGFLTSFTTPVIRFYPAVLRHLAGDDCFQEHRHKFVMGAMFVAELTCVLFYSLAQRNVKKDFWDLFMKMQVVTFVAAAFTELRFIEDHGTFITGMTKCAYNKWTS